MIVELAAVRLLAPWFGSSQTVWTNVIGVILLALSIGYAWGGRLAGGTSPVGALGMVLLVAGAWVTWLPWLGPAAARLLVPEGLALHEAAGLLGWGSLGAANLAFLAPAAMLGMVCPLVVEALSRQRGLSAGRAGGAVLFASTAGSLAGVFGTSHFLIPHLGLRRTYLLAGGLLLACGLLAWTLHRRRASRARPGVRTFTVLVACGSMLVPTSSPRPMTGTRILAQRDSPYQSLRVTEEEGTQGPPMRYLQVNEGLDSFQSVWHPQEGPLPSGYYYNDFLLPGCWTETTRPWKVLVLGLGAGSVVRVFSRAVWTDVRFVGIELDPVVVELGREYFDLDASRDRMDVHSGVDARVALNALGRFDQIVVDCYANQFEIPSHLCTVEFFREVRAKLATGGWLTANVGGYSFDDPVVATVAATCAAAFDAPVALVRVPMSRNFLLLARRDMDLPWSGGALMPPIRAPVIPLGPRLLPGFSLLVSPDSHHAVLTDDRCPIESLQRLSLLEARRLGPEGAAR